MSSCPPDRMRSRVLYCASSQQGSRHRKRSTSARLIVDDSPVALAILGAVFKGEHYEVETAGDGLDGFDKARQFEPDLVITDGLMPRADGFSWSGC